MGSRSRVELAPTVTLVNLVATRSSPRLGQSECPQSETKHRWLAAGASNHWEQLLGEN
jgi:hypothetical protein